MDNATYTPLIIISQIPIVFHTERENIENDIHYFSSIFVILLLIMYFLFSMDVKVAYGS